MDKIKAKNLDEVQTGDVIWFFNIDYNAPGEIGKSEAVHVEEKGFTDYCYWIDLMIDGCNRSFNVHGLSFPVYEKSEMMYNHRYYLATSEELIKQAYDGYIKSKIEDLREDIRELEALLICVQ